MAEADGGARGRGQRWARPTVGAGRVSDREARERVSREEVLEMKKRGRGLKKFSDL